MEPHLGRRDLLGLEDLSGSPWPDASEADIAAVAEQFGHIPRGPFQIVVRDGDGLPVVIKNWPLLYDGTPMPTLYWLTGLEQIREIGRLESSGGVNEAEGAVDADALQKAHDSYAAERDGLLGDAATGPRPSGGVAGTRRGVKCLHAHYASLLAGNDDPVGMWVVHQLRKASRHP